MRFPQARLLAVVAGLALSGALYLQALDRVPPFLSLDEAHFGVHAHALAHTGRNLNGDVMPLFVSLADPLGDQPALPWGTSWYHPVLFYLIALALKVLPLSEAAIRMPTALLGGIVNVALMFAVATRLLRSRWLGGLAAALLALCPANLILSRQALDYVMPVPFVLGWLWCLLAFMQSGRAGYALAGGVVLGAGCYSYVTSWIYMPMYLAVSWLACARSKPAGRRALALSIGGFVAPLLLLGPWLWSHPGMAGNILGQYQAPEYPYESAIGSLVKEGASVEVVRRMIAAYWSYFDPSFLFVMGGSSRNVSTALAGVFLMPVAVLLPLGMWQVTRRHDTRQLAAVLLIGLLAAPMLAAVKGSPFAIQRATHLLPFVALLSAVGAAALVQSSRLAARALATVLVVALGVQFAGFYRDYLTGYRVRSGHAYDPTAFGGAVAYLLGEGAAERAPAIYITAPLYDVSAKWRFYATKAAQPHLLERTRYFDGNLGALSDAPPGSLAVVEIDSPWIAPALQEGRWQVERTVRNLTGDATLEVLTRR